MLGQLPGQQEAHGGLDLPGGDGRPGERSQEDGQKRQRDQPLVVVSQLAGLGSDPLEEIVDEAVHDGHRLGGDAGVGMHLLQHLVDVDGVRLLPLALALLLVALGDGLGGLARLCSSLARGLGRQRSEELWDGMGWD